MVVRSSIQNIQFHKNEDRKLVCLTAYTAPMASILDPYCDVLLVGDSLGMVVYGMDNTLDVSLEMMIAHTKAVMRGSSQALIVADMPYGTYEDSPVQALGSAQRLINETECGAVKLEGGADMAPAIQAITQAGIPVMGHIGLQPQSVEKEGGYKIKGKTDAQVQKLLADAKAIEEAGAFSFVIEGTVEPVSRMITESVQIPTIGIGASAACDGQILVTEDLMGILDTKPPKFAKQYGDLRSSIGEMVRTYAKEVQTGEFPSADYLYGALKKAS